MHHPANLLRAALLVAAVALVSACGAKTDPDGPPEALGDFRLGYTIVVAKNAQMVPPSREATPEEWERVLTEELDRRFRSYEGDRTYHFGINVDGYALALPGVPVLLAPKSILVVSANVWDDAAGKKLNAEVAQLAVMEEISGDTLIGTGYTRDKDEQMRSLARNMAIRIERWLIENREDWFGHDPETPMPDAAASSAVAPAAATDPVVRTGPDPEGPTAN